MKQAIVLGANGFLGQNLIFWLLNNHFKIIAVDVQDTFKEDIFYEDAHITYIKADLTQLKEVNSIPLNQGEVIYMMAAYTGTKIGFQQYHDFVITNEISLLNVLHTYNQQKANARLVFPSSRLVYKGMKNKFLKENSSKDAKTVYAVNKIAGERYLQVWSNAFNIPYTIFRICVPYGQLIPGNYSFGTLGFMVKQAKNEKKITLYGDGSQKRTFTHVGDICEIFGKVPFLKSSAHKIINIGSKDNFAMHTLAEILAKKLNCEVRFKEWPELDYLIESGDTMFSDQYLQSIFPFSYNNTLEDYISQLN